MRSAARNRELAHRVLLVDHGDPILETLALELRCSGSLLSVVPSDENAVQMAKPLITTPADLLPEH
jgi:hypothetical protein